jgi:hypothetical protein
MQIRFILLQNRRGRTRLSKWFINYDENEKLRLQSEIHRMIVGRDSKQTDFIEVVLPPRSSITSRSSTSVTRASTS